VGAVSFSVAILADGEVPCHPMPRGILASAATLICCDGAYVKARALGREPDFVVGDGDSLDAASRATLGARFVHVAEQETNDLMKAFRFARATCAPTSVAILGACGLREDHTLGNIFRLPAMAAEVDEVVLFSEAGRFDVVRGARTFPCTAGDAVSVFAPEPATHATSEGLVWPLAGVDLAPLWSGTLNRAAGTSFTVAADRPLLVYRPW